MKYKQGVDKIMSRYKYKHCLLYVILIYREFNLHGIINIQTFIMNFRIIFT